MTYTFIDGARVICRAAGQFGLGHDGREIASLVIAQYDDSKDSFYLFALSAADDVVGDLLYSSVEKPSRMQSDTTRSKVGSIGSMQHQIAQDKVLYSHLA